MCVVHVWILRGCMWIRAIVLKPQPTWLKWESNEGLWWVCVWVHLSANRSASLYTLTYSHLLNLKLTYKVVYFLCEWWWTTRVRHLTNRHLAFLLFFQNPEWRWDILITEDFHHPHRVLEGKLSNTARGVVFIYFYEEHWKIVRINTLFTCGPNCEAQFIWNLSVMCSNNMDSARHSSILFIILFGLSALALVAVQGAEQGKNSNCILFFWKFTCIV